MPRIRVERMQEFIKQEIGKLLLDGLKDRRLGFVTVTDVSVTGDLREATVYVSLLGTPEEQNQSMHALESARGFIRSKIGEVLHVRYTPEIRFVVDESVAYGSRIEEVLHSLKEQEKNHGEDA